MGDNPNSNAIVYPTTPPPIPTSFTDPHLVLLEDARIKLKEKLLSVIETMTKLSTNDENRLTLPTSTRDSLVAQLEGVITAMKELPTTTGGRRSHKKRSTKRRRSRRHPK
jgi:hypothetical protein